VITTTEVQQVPPVFSRAPDLSDPSGTLAVWFTEPPGAWLQFVKPARGTDELSEWLVGPALEAGIARFPGQALILVCDFRLMRDRELSARARLLQTAPALKELLGKVVLIPSLSATPIHLKTMGAGAALLRSFGIQVELQTSVPYVMSQFGLVCARS
jgi:hypothetical protein